MSWWLPPFAETVEIPHQLTVEEVKNRIRKVIITPEPLKWYSDFKYTGYVTHEGFVLTTYRTRANLSFKGTIRGRQLTVICELYPADANVLIVKFVIIIGVLALCVWAHPMFLVGFVCVYLFLCLMMHYDKSAHFDFFRQLLQDDGRVVERVERSWLTDPYSVKGFLVQALAMFLPLFLYVLFTWRK